MSNKTLFLMMISMASILEVCQATGDLTAETVTFTDAEAYKGYYLKLLDTQLHELETSLEKNQKALKDFKDTLESNERVWEQATSNLENYEKMLQKINDKNEKTE